MGEIKYTARFKPYVRISFDKNGNVMSHELNFEEGEFIELYDHKSGGSYRHTEEAEKHLGTIIYGSLMEHLDKLGITEMFYNPDDEPF